MIHEDVKLQEPVKCKHCSLKIDVCKCGYEFCMGCYHIHSGLHFCDNDTTYAEVETQRGPMSAGSENRRFSKDGKD